MSGLSGNLSVINQPMPALSSVSDKQSPPDMTGQFNTQLSPDEERKFQTWVTASGRARDLIDYDLRGAWKADAKQAANGHLPDTWKKPNHPTFSVESMYNGNGGLVGGRWIGDDKAGWSFQPGPANYSVYGLPNLERYMTKYEPGVKLLPLSPVTQPASP